jgi:hypothetical protein
MDSKAIKLSKDRESKIFNLKAEVYAKEMQTITGAPKIDPVSRKVADIITKRELELLGIHQIEHIPKLQISPCPKSTQDKPGNSTRPIRKSDSKKLLDRNEISPISPIKGEYDIDKRIYDNINLNLNLDLPEFGNELSRSKSDFNPQDKESEQPEILKPDDLAENPVKYLVEFTKEKPDQPIDISFNKQSPIEEIQTEFPSVKSIKKIPAKKSFGTETQDKLNKTAPIGHFRSKTDLISVYSKTEKKSFKEVQSIELNLQSLYEKASFLHTPQEKVSKAIPRCHINLANCKTSPIYFSVRIASDSKVKCENGVALVDSLRRLLLNNPVVDEDPKPKNIYDKNLKWLQRKTEKIEEIRDNLKDNDLKACTFDPFYSKHESDRKNRNSLDVKGSLSSRHTRSNTAFISKNNDSKAYTPRIPENTITYVSLSPADSSVSYKEGFSIEKFIERAKPMVSYRQISLLT